MKTLFFSEHHPLCSNSSGVAIEPREELLHLIAGDLALAVENAQELPRHWLGIDWRRFLALVGVLVDELVDADQRILTVIARPSST